MFTGTVRVKIFQAQGLRPTDCSRRHTFGKADEQPLDPYVTIVVDDTQFARTATKQKTFDPVWNEQFEHAVENSKSLTLTVFHDAAIPPDVFVANCTITFEDLVSREKDEGDFWVSVIFIVSPFSDPFKCQNFNSVPSGSNLMTVATSFPVD